MFENKNFDLYSFEQIPLNRDVYLVDDQYIEKYEKMMLDFLGGDEYKSVGYVAYAAARAISDNSVELSWYPNTSDRFHEVYITLPKDEFVACVGSSNYDEKARVFVKTAWLNSIYLRSYSIFCMIDAIGVKSALENGVITKLKLSKLRDEIDELSKSHPKISFVSFADSLLLKSNWSVGTFESEIKYTYEPEVFISLAAEIDEIYKSVLGLSTYAIISQGGNEYYDDTLLHISESRNHISLNSLGIPFAQIMEIENTVRQSIREGVHSPADLYLDENYYHSLKFKFEFDKNNKPCNGYRTKMRERNGVYYYFSTENMINNLESGEKQC